MNKSDLINTLSKKKTLTEKSATEIVNLIFTGFTDTLIKGDRIEIKGFGSFSERGYGASTGRNPRTGKKIDVGSKRGSVFQGGEGVEGEGG